MFEDLKSKMRACTACTDLPLGPNPIFQLDARAKILIAGQAPGRITHHKNRPFDDPSGDRLRDWLGVNRTTFYEDPRIGIFPMALCYPGTGSSGDKPPPGICAATWRNRVMQSLGDIELVLVLGAYAMAWHLPQLKGKSVTHAVRQSATGEADVFVLPHPSPRNNRWLQRNAWFEIEALPRIREKVETILNEPKAD